MKKIAVFSLMLLFMGSLASANGVVKQESYPLYAGQDLLVGQVLIGNNPTHLCVRFELSTEAMADGWLIYETHWAVAYDEEYIPQNKQGNPQPGQFPYGDGYLGGVPSYEECQSFEELGINCGDDLVIAAHAKLAKTCWETVWQIGDVEVLNAGTGWLENYADEFNWGAPAGPTTAGPTLAENEPQFTNPFIVGVTPVSEFPYNSNFNRGYATDFDVQWSGGLPYGGRLLISWSPGQSAAEKKIVSDEGFPSTDLTATGTPQSGMGWFLDTYPLIEDEIMVDTLADGIHTINFQHTQGDGTFWDWIRLEQPCKQEASAWGAEEGGGTRFVDRGNWATYFEYEVECSD